MLLTVINFNLRLQVGAVPLQIPLAPQVLVITPCSHIVAIVTCIHSSAPNCGSVHSDQAIGGAREGAMQSQSTAIHIQYKNACMGYYNNNLRVQVYRAVPLQAPLAGAFLASNPRRLKIRPGGHCMGVSC